MSNLNKVIVGFLVLLVLCGVGIFVLNIRGYNIIPTKQPVAIIKNQRIDLLITKTQQDREIGLSKYKSIPNNQGMLFSFGKQGYYSFWMKDMKFPIDIIYISNDKIVTIYPNVMPPKKGQGSPPLYNPTAPSDTVLEINANLSKKYNFKTGDKITYENLSS
ncbi:MAG: hypothetical protein A2152_02715 [Candidatus Levybacteria bacterium RBG_16_35_6]|nr:MAG: hypothetical protein A2152_02715 [Candidatus Levybacteria bacterium RBG_16_35_6]